MAGLEHAQAETGPVLVNSAKLQERNQHFPSPTLGEGAGAHCLVIADSGKLSLVTNATGCQSPVGPD